MTVGPDPVVQALPENGFVITVKPMTYMVDYKNIHQQFLKAEEMDSLLIASGGSELSGHIIIRMDSDAVSSQIIDLIDVLQKDSIKDYSLVSSDN